MFQGRNPKITPNEVLSSKVSSDAVLTGSSEGRESVDLFETLEGRAVWTVEEIGDLLHMSVKTLYKHAALGKIPSFKIGTCVRIYGKALADSLRKKMN
jgi:excisionase family DNA binding protein